MKIIRAILTAAVVSAAFAMAGCDLGGGNSREISWPEIASVEEKCGGITTLTEYMWDEQYRTHAEIKTVGDKILYEDTGYELNEEELTITYYRKFYGDDGTTVDRTHERVLTYLGYWFGPVKFESFDRTLSTTPVEKWEKTFDAYGNLANYKRYENGILVEERYDYNYTTYGDSKYPVEYTIKYPAVGETPEVVKTMTERYIYNGNRVYNDRTETKIGGELVEYKQWSYAGGVQSYETYKVEGEGDDNKTLVEELTDYAVNGMIVTYKITRCDENTPAGVVTEYIRVLIPSGILLQGAGKDFEGGRDVALVQYIGYAYLLFTSFGVGVETRAGRHHHRSGSVASCGRVTELL